MFLKKIVKAKRGEVEQSKGLLPLVELKSRLRDLAPPKDLVAALDSRACNVIAEIKRSSPSKGRLRDDFDPLKIASVYAENGASALSILTDRQFFEGDKSYLAEIGKAVKVPLLRKDFIIDPYQIYETRVIGGDALLLIAGLLDAKELGKYLGLSLDLGLSPLVEVHNGEELKKALSAGARLIGINNRDLNTFTTDLGVSLKLVPLIPDGVSVVSESGIKSRKDVETLMDAGIHSFLIGETLMRADDMGRKLRELMGRESD
jgi:indole-3-glycerol phosphate synthase